MRFPHSLTCIVIAVSILINPAQAIVGFSLHHRLKASSQDLSRRDSINTPLFQAPSQYEYLVAIQIGTPLQSLNVSLDTGSTGLWVPSSNSSQCRSGKCDGGSFNSTRSDTYKLLQQNSFRIGYASGSGDSGDVVSDVVSFGGSTSIQNVRFGLATTGSDEHGVMGIGMNMNTGNGINGTVTEDMYQQGLIQRRAFSLYLNDLRNGHGNILFGGVDPTKYTGDLVALPMQPSSDGAYNDYLVTLTGVSFTSPSGQTSQLTPSTFRQKVLLDSGSTTMLLDSDIYAAIANGMGGVDVGNQFIAVPCKYNNINATINYQFGGSDGPIIRVPLNQIMAQQFYSSSQINDASGGCALQIGPPVGGQTILGDAFLRSAYVVFDIDNKVVAMAQAALNQTSTSSMISMGSGTSIPGVSRTATASGTSIGSVAAISSPSVRTASGTSISVRSPTFNLAATSNGGDRAINTAATSTISTSNIASVTAKTPTVSGTSSSVGSATSTSTHAAAVAFTPHPTAALLGLALLAVVGPVV